jgi:hypothetical protein
MKIEFRIYLRRFKTRAYRVRGYKFANYQRNIVFNVTSNSFSVLLLYLLLLLLFIRNALAVIKRVRVSLTKNFLFIKMLKTYKLHGICQLLMIFIYNIRPGRRLSSFKLSYSAIQCVLFQFIASPHFFKLIQ